jgi:uncharacterized protein YcbK (DUF882 family)
MLRIKEIGAAEHVEGTICDLGRRQFIVQAARIVPLAALSALPLRAVAGAMPPSDRACSLTLLNTHTRESLCATYRVGSEFDTDSLARFSHLLRDHRDGTMKAIDPSLFDILHNVASRLGVDPHFEVISGYRSPETNALLHERSSGVASHSLHMDGKAIDVRLAGVNTRHLFDAALKLGHGGCGYYGKSDFAHLDTGRVRHWGA